MRCRDLGFALTAMMALAASPALAMDCKRAATPVEKLICADTDLMTADQRLNEAYQLDLSAHDNPKDITADQKAWIKSKRDVCTDAVCVKEVYRQRLASIKSAIDCANPVGEYERLSCSAQSEADLGKLVADRLNGWRPYLTKLNDLPDDPAQAEQKWDAVVKANSVAPGLHCRNFECRRAETAKKLEEVTFPKEVYERFLAWVSASGARSSFLAPDKWTLTRSEVEPLWKLSAGRLVYIGDLPDWLQTEYSSDFEQPTGQPLFLDRQLTGAEAFNLRRMVWHVSANSPSKNESIAGVSVSTMGTVRFDDGGGAKCSANPLASYVWIRNAFPPQANSDHAGESFKVIEKRRTPVEQRVPTCALEEPYPDGFFDGKETFKSDLVIDAVQSEPFVRPDGTFWLKLDDDRWVRFRRDMTSDAKDVGSRYMVLSKDQFDGLVAKSTTMGQLGSALRK